jgi:bifunctional UDP-N-acetylglucosamine pyrophosphorylase / glucosamine-1-phosphate N-acetyltransferase
MAHVVILAAGKGTRMKSDLPKTLHPVKGVPILNRLLESVFAVCPKPSIIVNHNGDLIREATGNSCNYIFQEEQLGTGHAVMVAKDDLSEKGYDTILVLLGDHPLVSVETLKNLEKVHKEKKATITMATAVVPHFEENFSVFHHYGRVIRNGGGQVKKIVEFKDATEDEREVKEVNLAYYCFDAKWLWENISKLNNNNASGEYYLTDMIGIAVNQGKNVEACVVKDYLEGMGVNTPEQLKIIEDRIEEKEAAKA